MSAETPTNPYSAFEKMTDEEVVLKAKEDNVLAQEYLLHKYRKFVRAKARSYFLIGAEREDIQKLFFNRGGTRGHYPGGHDRPL